MKLFYCLLPEEFRFDICGEVKQVIKENSQGIIQKTIPAMRCAKIQHKGPHDIMEDKVYFLYREWLSTNNEKTRDFPLFLQYHNFFPEVSEAELITDIFLPLE